MKFIAFLFCCLLSCLAVAQVRVSGTVMDVNQKPLQGASIYLDKTSIGTTTNSDGVFSFLVPKGEHQLVVSYIGFHSQTQDINTKNLYNSIVFILKKKSDVLDEVVIQNRKRITLDQKKDFLRLFQREFIGTSKVAERCRILNKEVLEYDFDPITQNLNITATEPIQISNPSLGYILHYDLRVFQLTSGIVYYAGNLRFEEMEASKKKKKRLHKNRRKAYHGSFMHFLRSIINGDMQYQGFVVHHVRRVPNSPLSEEVEKNAREFEYRQEIIKLNVLPKEYSRFNDDVPSLRFTDHLRITYTHEFPDENFPQRNEFKNQESLLSLDSNEIQILKPGVLKKPLEAFVLGYWSFEKVGDLLPLDFKP